LLRELIKKVTQLHLAGYINAMDIQKPKLSKCRCGSEKKE